MVGEAADGIEALAAVAALGTRRLFCAIFSYPGVTVSKLPTNWRSIRYRR